MSGLKDQFEGVNVDPPATVDDDQPQDDIVIDDEPIEPADAGAEGDVDADDKPEGRTPDNVHREMSRKYEALQGELTGMRSMMSQFLDKVGTPQPAQSKSKERVEDYSVAELTAYRDGLDADDARRPELERVIIGKQIDAKVDERVESITGKQAAMTAKTSALNEALNRYPDLRDENSDLYKTVDAELKSRGDSYATSNPHAILDVASYVAQRDGVTAAKTTVRSPNRPGSSKRDSAQAPVAGTKEDYPMTLEEAKSIAAKMKKAMGRDFTDKEIERIRKGHAAYAKDINLYTR